MMLKTIYLIFLGLTSGCMVAAGTFAFIAAIGIVPRMAKRTETQRFIRVYEDAIVLGGIWGQRQCLSGIVCPPCRCFRC